MKWDLILSAAAVGISIWAILKSYSVDRRQKKYLDIQISEHDQKEEDRRKANPCGTYRRDHFKGYLTIENKGQAFAKNLCINFPPEEFKKLSYGNSIPNPISIDSLGPPDKKSYETTLICSESISEIQVIFKWDDDYETGRTKEATIHIN